MSRPRLYRDAAAKQRAYRERLKARRRERQGPTNADLAGVVRDLHIRLEYAAAVTPSATASKLAGNDALATLRNVVERLFEIEGI
jgi:hypothetical protein